MGSAIGLKLLLMGGSHAEVPIIQAAKDRGFWVITTGNDPSAHGHGYADEFVYGDYSDSRAMLDLAVAHEVDEICPCANDFSIISASYVSHELGIGVFDTPEVTELIHHKDRFRAFCLENHYPVPDACRVTSETAAVDALRNLRFPVIVKPVDLSGGKGIARADTYEQALTAVRAAFARSRAKRLVIEEFIEGTNHGFSCLITDKQVVFYFQDDEHYANNPYVVSGASCPSSLTNGDQRFLIDQVEALSRDLDLVNGIVHVQLIKSESGIHLVEVCRRPPGDLYIDFVKQATGFDYPGAILDYYIKGFCERSAPREENELPPVCLTRHCVMSDFTGRFGAITIADEIRDNIVGSYTLSSEGDLIDDLNTYKAGIIFVRYRSLAEMKRIQPRLEQLIRVERHDSV